ncbi:MAG: hypothetical protein OEX21_04000 [Betaproteobacteria bacterium]|nr:hypothetical protein [Betaproteobacteria bacterium]
MLAVPQSSNSTTDRSINVRPQHFAPEQTEGIPESWEDAAGVRNTLVTALGLWAGAVALGARAGVFARLPGEVLAALAVFATAFAIAVVLRDVRVRDWLDGRRRGTARVALLLTATVLAVLVAGLPSGTNLLDITGVPGAPILLFGVPVVAALWLSVAGAAWRAAAARLRPPASTAPALRRAAS